MLTCILDWFAQNKDGFLALGVFVAALVSVFGAILAAKTARAFTECVFHG